MKSFTDIFAFILTKNCIILPPEKDRQLCYSQKGNHQSGLHQSQKVQTWVGFAQELKKGQTLLWFKRQSKRLDINLIYTRARKGRQQSGLNQSQNGQTWVWFTQECKRIDISLIYKKVKNGRHQSGLQGSQKEQTSVWFTQESKWVDMS